MATPRAVPTLAPESLAESLVRGVETLIAKLSDPSTPMPLELLERYQRALMRGHVANLVRLDDAIRAHQERVG